MLRVAESVERTRAEGPGERLALWLQGCSIGCPGCCNPHMLDPRGGRELTESAGLALLEGAARAGLDGVTLLGGEPFDQARELAPFAVAAGSLGLGVVVFTGYSLEQLRRRREPGVQRLLAAVDLLIDGPYEMARHSLRRRWIGSDNQRVRHLSSRYSGDPQLADEYAQSVHITIADGELLMSGWPVTGLREQA